MNATLSISDSQASLISQETLSFPIFDAGHERSRGNWVNDSQDLPSGLKGTYTAAQAKLMCTSQV